MKNLILPLALIISVFGFSQSNTDDELDIRKEVRVESVDVVVTVDSAEELESTFTVDDIKEMFDLTNDNESVSFKLVCNGDVMSSGKKSHMSYKVEGTTKDHKAFIKRVEAVRKAAIKFYNNKK